MSLHSNSNYERATQETTENLQTIAKSLALQKLTKLSLPEVDAVVGLVAKVIPAGNVPGMILSGLTRISGSRVQPQKARQDINILFKEASLFFEQAKYGAIFAGPAAIIWGYQNLLKLAGKDQESAFPEGIWQFYVDYALREDTARHANETYGFDSLLDQNHIHLNEIDRLTAWVMSAVTCLHQYQALLKNEWYERTALWLLQEAASLDNLYSEWEKQKLYLRDAEAADYDYPSYRQLKFERFLNDVTASLSPSVYRQWNTNLKTSAENSLAAYQKQMSILAYLEPSPFGETRVPFSLEQAQIGVVHQGNYYLLPICEPGTSKPLDVRTARTQIALLISASQKEASRLTNLAQIKRADLSILCKKLSPLLQNNLNKLKFAPILINSDRRQSGLLSEIRQGERGIGDHALTIFDTGRTFVFDQSHIFFDGGWGAALAEIMTNEALSWAHYLNMLGSVTPRDHRIYAELGFAMESADIKLIDQASRVSLEAGAENQSVNIKAFIDLRNYFKQRSDLLRLTINDLLVLYRAIHAATYQPSVVLQREVDALEKLKPEVVSLIKQILKDVNALNPAILMPIDASKSIPRDRIYPLNMEVPLAELDFLNLHKAALQTVIEFESQRNADDELFARFDNIQRRYLATLGGFGTILAKAKDIAVRGESASVGAIKLLAHMPLPLKQLLDRIPTRYEKLNNLLKGTEVFSNIGAVAKSSSLSRFITAKDDNEQKQLAWGVMTDTKGVMKITLRDFRPHVAVLHSIGRKDLANNIAQDYLDAYAEGLNQFVQEVTRIAVARPRKSTDQQKA
jgi:hypothetical protein